MYQYYHYNNNVMLNWVKVFKTKYLWKAKSVESVKIQTGNKQASLVQNFYICTALLSVQFTTNNTARNHHDRGKNQNW